MLWKFNINAPKQRAERSGASLRQQGGAAAPADAQGGAGGSGPQLPRSEAEECLRSRQSRGRGLYGAKRSVCCGARGGVARSGTRFSAMLRAVFSCKSVGYGRNYSFSPVILYGGESATLILSKLRCKFTFVSAEITFVNAPFTFVNGRTPLRGRCVGCCGALPA